MWNVAIRGELVTILPLKFSDFRVNFVLIYGNYVTIRYPRTAWLTGVFYDSA